MSIYGYAATAALFAAVGWIAAGAATATGEAPRFPQLTMADLTDAQRPLGEAIMKISRVGIAGPYNREMPRSRVGQRMFDLLAYLRWNSSVPLRLNEFTIL